MQREFRVTRRRAIAALAAFASTAMAKPAVAREAWPNGTVRLLVGYPPGGSIDVLARIVASEFRSGLGQSFVVENRPGASSNIAASEVARATPDGHTLLVSSTSTITANPSLYKSNFDAATDLVPVSSIGRSAIYVVARSTLPANDINELVVLSKKDRLTFGSAGTGTQPHLAGELLKMRAGIQATHVPYKGSLPALQDLISNQIDYMLDPGIALPYIQSGKAKLLGVISSKRSPFFPQVATVGEQGISGADVEIWYGIWAPKGTPAGVMARLLASVQPAIKGISVKDRFAAVSAEPEVIGGEAFRAIIAKEREVFSHLIRQLGISV